MLPYDVSVVVSTYNRCESLRDTINSLVLQRVGNNLKFEILVIDNNSTDQTRAVAEELARESKIQIRYFHEVNQGKSYAMNCGTRAASGKVIAYFDDDVVAGPDWIQSICEAFSTYNADVIGGPVKPLWLGKPPRWLEDPARQFGMLALLDRGNQPVIAGEAEAKTGNFLIGSNIAIKKSVLDESGLFRTDLGRSVGNLGGGEDSEMIRRLLARGKQIVYIPHALVYHKVPAKRMTLRYMRGWNYWMARTTARMSEFRQVTPGVLLLECAKSAAAALIYYVFGKCTNAVGAEINFWWRLGTLVELLSGKREPAYANG